MRTKKRSGNRKVLLVSHELTYTGAPHSLLNIAGLLRQKGFAVDVLSLKKGAFSREFAKRGFRVKVINEKEFDPAELVGKYYFALANTIFAGEFALKIQGSVKTFLYIREAENLNSIMFSCGSGRGLIEDAENLICVSEYAEQYIKRNFTVKNLSVIRNFLFVEGVPEIVENIAENNKVHFLVAGTLEPRKGTAAALEAMELLPRETREKAVLHIAGKKPDWAYDYWKDLNTDAAPNVIYHGEITDDGEMDRLYRLANVVVVPSLDESCSLAALEGAMRGRALIVTENVGAKYLVDQSRNIVKTGSARALAEAFEYMVENREKLAQMGKRSFELFMSTSTPQIYWENFERAVLKNTVCGDIGMKEMNVCFIADEGYLVPTAAAITSFCENSDKEYRCNVFVIMPNGVSREAKKALISNAEHYPNVTVGIVEAGMDELSGLHKGDSKVYLAATETALLKFEIAELFPDLDKILYLDGDIIVRDDLTALYETDISDFYAAAVRDLPQVLYKEQPLGADINGRDYFNSGVMLLNLKRMRAENIKKKLIEAKKSCADQSLMDQSIFNIVFKKEVLQLSFLYNVCYVNMLESRNRYDIKLLNERYLTSYKNVYEILPDIKIMHFSSKLKPWLFFDVPLADEWLRYYKHSSFGNVPLQRISHTERNVDMEAVKKKVKGLSAPNDHGFKRKIPIAMAANDEYMSYAAVTIQSIYERSDPKNFYDIYIFADGELSINTRRKFAHISYANIRVTLLDVKNCFNGIDLYSVGHYSKQMYYRWLIPEVLSLYDKVLYLDCDLVVNRDVAYLYDVNIGSCYIGAAQNFLRDNLRHHVTERLGLDTEEYYNSGVLLINCKAWLDNGIKSKCIDFLKSKEKLACPDQDVINVVCKGRIHKLDDKWNFQWHHQFPDTTKGDFLLDYEKRYKALLSSVPWIVHYTSFVKPWKASDRAYAEYFWKYCRNCDFYESILFFNMNAATVKKDDKTAPVDGNAKRLKELQEEVDNICGSFTYKLSRIINFIPRKIKGYEFTPLAGEDESCVRQIDSLNNRICEIRNSRAFKLALKITALPRKIRGKNNK